MSTISSITHTPKRDPISMESGVKETLAHLFAGVGISPPQFEKIEGKVEHLTADTIVGKLKAKYDGEIKTEEAAVKKYTRREKILWNIVKFMMATAAVAIVGIMAFVWPIAGPTAAIVSLLCVKGYLILVMMADLGWIINGNITWGHERDLKRLRDNIEQYEEDVHFIFECKGKCMTEEEMDNFDWNDESKVHELREQLIILKKRFDLQEKCSEIAEEKKTQRAISDVLNTAKEYEMSSLENPLAYMSKMTERVDGEEKAILQQLEEQESAVKEALAKVQSLVNGAK